ncbi:MAG: DNA helicase [Pirellulaceae bacterium]|nr:MAG: DNA helicase [Pirellulaceae bacterium]
MIDTERLLDGLNAAQRDAVTHLEGPLLVLAGPGSGKTRVITHRIAHLMATGVADTQIVGLTFTNKAAQEMQRRLEALVGPTRVWLGTFHGFCVRLLRQYARLVGLPENFTIYDADDAMAVLKQVVKDAQLELTHVSPAQLAQRISFFKSRLVTPEVLQEHAHGAHDHLVAEVYPAYQQMLLSHGAVDFDDILMHVATLLKDHQELRQQLDARWPFLLVDEYQDTNLAQYVIVRHLKVDHPHLTATGDPDQAIYGWRGANVKNVAYLERDYPQLRIVRLEENYRSTSPILAAADYLISHNTMRKPKQLFSTRGEGTAVRLTVYASGRQEAEDIAQQIAEAVEQQGLNFSDFAVLYRTNAQSRLFEQSLARRGIPFQIIGGFRFYQRQEVKDLMAYLLLLYNPDDNLALERAINVPPRGIGPKTLGKLRQLAAQRRCPLLEACRQAVAEKLIAGRARKSLQEFLATFDTLASMVHGPVFDLLDTTIERIGYREYLEGRSSPDEHDGGEILDELLEEARELDDIADEEVMPLERLLEGFALQSDVDKLDLGSDRVTLMTLHAAKGLEFRHVFIAAVEENILPHARSKDDPLGIEEERRLLFVGMTRAQDALQISYARSRGFGGNGGVPSSFLMELPRQEMAFRDLSVPISEWDAEHQSYADSTWDEYSQVFDHSEEPSEQANDWDYCQLPEEERQQRQRKRGSSAEHPSRTAANLPSLARTAIRVGIRVYHDEYGSGRVIAVSGHGQRRSVTVDFLADGTHRTFLLAFSPLTIEAAADDFQ